MNEIREERPRDGRPRRSAAPAILGALLAAAGIVWLLAAVDVVAVPAQAAIGALLVLVGLAVALLPEGGYQGLLVAAGIALALAGTAASAIRVDLVADGAGERIESPATPADLEAEYAHGVGSLRLDLTRLPLEEAETDVRATIGIGELVVTVPANASVDVRARIGIGEVQVRGRRRSGFGADLSARSEREGPVIRLELEGGIGSIRVADGGRGDGDL